MDSGMLPKDLGFRMLELLGMVTLVPAVVAFVIALVVSRKVITALLWGLAGGLACRR